MKCILSLAALTLTVCPAWGQDDDPDRKTPSRALFTNGLRAEGASPSDLVLALSKYKKAVIRAKEEKNDDVAAGALIHIARCNEKLNPANLEAARGAYEEVLTSYPEMKPWGALAREKLVLRGVDVWLLQLDTALNPWRLTLDQSPQALVLLEERAVIGGKILSLGKQAIPGLIWGLGHADPVIRDCAAGWLAEVIDEAGIATVLAKLNDPSPGLRAGAATALRKVFLKYEEAASLERQARTLDEEIHLRISERTKSMHDRLAGEVAALRRSASALRKYIPANLDTPHIEAALQRIVADESALPEERCEAAGAVMKIGRISGPLVDALLKGMDSQDRNVRASCCRAGGSVDPQNGEDRLRIADRLIRAVSYEPSKDDRRVTPDWANDEVVRQAAAAALEQIGLVKSIPGLIRALDDSNAMVRKAAFRALRRITGKNLPLENGRAYEADQALPERREAQARWQEWWKATSGIGVLVDRFWLFQSTCENPNPMDLFYPSAFLKNDLSRRWIGVDPASDMEGAARLQEELQRQKDVMVQDAVDIGPEALDCLLGFIGGENEHEHRPNAATRAFVAEVCARLIRTFDMAGGIERLRTMLLKGESEARKAGAAMAFGFLGRDNVSAADRQLLETSGLGAPDPEVRAAAALALALVGDERSAAGLTRAALDREESVVVAALRALVEIHPRNPDTVATLGHLIADEPVPGTTSKKALSGMLAPIIREYASTALGAIGDPAALEFLLRARRDELGPVREAASHSVEQLYAQDPMRTNEYFLKVLRDEHCKAEDRRAAVLCLGDRRDPSLGKDLVETLVDPSPPRKVRDSDPGVRIAICEALGSLREKGKMLTVVDHLIRSLADEDEQINVREAAYAALTAIRGIDPDRPGGADQAFGFRASDPRAIRSAAVAKWQSWFSGEKGSLKDPI